MDKKSYMSDDYIDNIINYKELDKNRYHRISKQASKTEKTQRIKDRRKIIALKKDLWSRAGLT